MPKVSVIIPVFNGEATIQRTLRSILEQTFRDIEIIVCIDGSNDNSEKIISETLHASSIPFTILRNEQNLGLAQTMNHLVKNTTGEYIAIAEQDDVYVPNRLSKQVQIFNQNQNIGIVSGIAEFFNYNTNTATGLFPGLLVHGKQYPSDKTENFLMHYIQQIKIVNSCMMFRKSMHEENGLYFDKTYENVSVDWSYILRAALVTQFYGITDVLVRLDRTPGRTNITQNKIKQYQTARALLLNFRNEYPHLITASVYSKAYHTQARLELGSIGLKKLPSAIFNYPPVLVINEMVRRLKRKLRIK